MTDRGPDQVWTIGGPGEAGRHHGGTAKVCIKRAFSAGSPLQK